MVKKFVLFVLISFLSLKVCYAQEWQEARGDHFIVLYSDNSNKSFVQEVLRKSESCYERIARDLGYARHSNFWQWDKRVKIFIYPTQEEFLKLTKQPQWSQGQADYFKKEISGYSGCRGFIDSILPHEIAHLIFRDFVGFPGTIPLWLDEGVAQWEEPDKRLVVKSFVRRLYEDGKLLSLKDLTQTDIRLTEEGAKAQDFYVQAAALVDFLMSKYGADDFTNLCRQLRDGKGLDEAIRFSYSSRIGGLEDLEKKFVEYIKTEV